MTTGFETYDGSDELNNDLAFVRRLLDDLASARSLGAFRPADLVRYKRLCEKERQLLRGGAKAPADAQLAQSGQLEYENAHRGVLRRGM